jgi:protein-L-isoaspartate(D-aspartate) O-methyltransferase
MMDTENIKPAKKLTYAFSSAAVLFLLLSGNAILNDSKKELVFASENTEPNKPPSDVNETQKQEKPQVKKPSRSDHSHPSFNERIGERARMVSSQISSRGIRDPNTLEALKIVPRHFFVGKSELRRAYGDYPLPIGFGQTISQPYIVGYMTEALKLGAKDKVLEIGTGSGYQAAVCAEIAQEVYTIEIIEELAESAKGRLKELGYENVFVKAADGFFGWEEKGPFDAIIITCAAGFVPPPLIEQLKPDGKMILPLGSPFGAQTLVLVTKNDKGEVRSESLLPVRFVPMVGHIKKAEK